MAFTAFTAAQTDTDSPLDQTFTDLIRTNFDDHESRISALFALGANGILDDFSLTTIDTATWATSGGAITYNAEHNITLGVGFTVIRGAVGKMLPAFADEYVVTQEYRVKASNHTSAQFIGLQDSTLDPTVVGTVTDYTNCVGIYVKNANNWTFRVANGGASESVDFAPIASWQTIKVVMTCSHTAGNRKVQAYLNGTEITGSPFTSNITGQRLRCYAASGSLASVTLDYYLSYFGGRPLAA
jgi:hypothetical protein